MKDKEVIPLQFRLLFDDELPHVLAAASTISATSAEALSAAATTGAAAATAGAAEALSAAATAGILPHILTSVVLNIDSDNSFLLPI